MKPEKIHRDRDEMIEKYLRNELSDQETDLFEMHLLSCEECRTEVVQRGRIHDSLEKYAAHKTFQTGRKRNQQSKRLKLIVWSAGAAAAAAFIIGLLIFPDRETSTPYSQEASSDTVQTEEDPMNLTEEGREEIQSLPKERIANLASFQVHPVYENQIGIHARAYNLSVESPSDSIECTPGALIEFNYQGTGVDSFYFVLLNNLGDILLEEKISSPYSLQLQFPEGLYYWQLTDEEEALHTAKILIR